MIKHLYNSDGLWVAFKKGVYLFDTSGKWLGWFPEKSAEAVDIHGEYLGTIVDKNRFYHLAYNTQNEFPPYPGYPGDMLSPGYPGYAGHSPLPFGAEDVSLER